MSQIAAVVGLVVEIDVETDEIEKVQLEILGRGIVRIREQALGVVLLADVVEFSEKAAHAASAVPSHDIRANLVAESIGEDRFAMLPHLGDRGPDRAADVA